jgi:hypothetical protein
MINSNHNVLQKLREKKSVHPKDHLLRARSTLSLADVELLFVVVLKRPGYVPAFSRKLPERCRQKEIHSTLLGHAHRDLRL